MAFLNNPDDEFGLIIEATKEHPFSSGSNTLIEYPYSETGSNSTSLHHSGNGLKPNTERPSVVRTFPGKIIAVKASKFI